MRVLTWLLSFMVIGLLALFVATMSLTDTNQRPIVRPTTSDFSSSMGVLSQWTNPGASKTIQLTPGQAWLASQAAFAQAGLAINQQFIFSDNQVLWQLDWPVAGIAPQRYLPTDISLTPVAQFPYAKIEAIQLANWQLPNWLVAIIEQQVLANIDNHTAALIEQRVNEITITEDHLVLTLQ